MPMINFTPSEIRAMQGRTDYGQGLTWYEIQALGFKQLVRDIDKLEANWDKKSAKELTKIAKNLRMAAQPRSPYLYGVLRGAHFDTLLKDSSFWGGQAGLVAIDPEVTHYVLGGRPNVYGAEIHAGSRGAHRPWFAWTLEQQGPSIIEEGGNEFKGIYAEYLDKTMFGAL